MYSGYSPKVRIDKKLYSIINESKEKTIFKEKLLNSVEENDITFVIGCGGSGKTYSTKDYLGYNLIDLSKQPKYSSKYIKSLNNGKPIIFDEIGYYFNFGKEVGSSIIVNDFYNLSKNQPIVLIGDYRLFDRSVDFYSNIVRNDKLIGKNNLVINSLWSNELVEQICTEHYKTSKEYSNQMKHFSNGMGRVLNFMIPSLKVGAKYPFADYNMMYHFQKSIIGNPLVKLVKGEKIDDKVKTLLEDVGIFSKQESNNIKFKSEFFKYILEKEFGKKVTKKINEDDFDLITMGPKFIKQK